MTRPDALRTLRTLGMGFAAVLFGVVVWRGLQEAYAMAPAQTLSRIAVGIIGSALLAGYDYWRRTDRVRGAKDRLEWLNRGGTRSWE